MITRLLSLAGLVASVALTAQNQAVNLSMGPGYANDLYYSFANGLVKSEPGNNWHLAFTARVVDASIMINEVNTQVQAFVGANDTTSWATLDTTGQMWTPLHNSDQDWTLGALSNLGTSFPDYGWGVYNTITHNVFGNRIFVIKIGAVYKKFMVRSMKANGEYTFRIANLDGTNELLKVVSKASYAGKNFFYYDAINDQFIDREPATTAWDFVARRYLTVIQNQWYPVTGIQTNLDRVSAKVTGVDTASNDWSTAVLNGNIANIGSDWKSFNNTTFQWQLADSTTYFATAGSGDLYKVVFTAFAGSSSGNFSFNQKMVSALSTPEVDLPQANIYPNPARGLVNLEVAHTEGLTSIRIVDFAGRTVRNLPIVETQRVEGLRAGAYLVVLETPAGATVQKLLIQ
jgi:hypothetical protein